MAYDEQGKMKISAILTVFLLIILFAGNEASGSVAYTVKEGDSLSRIAGQYLPYTDSYTTGELIQEIRKLNNLSDKSITAGQELAIPVVRDAPVKAEIVRKPKDFIARGIYVNQANAGNRQIFTLAERLKKSGANTVIFDAKEIHGALAYKSQIPGTFTPVASYRNSIDEISKLIDNLHKMDIHVVARVCVFRDILMASNMKDWRYSDEWVNPANKKVQEYNLAIMKELIGLGVDEIQLDYFRYPADGRNTTGVEGKSRSDVLTDYLARIHDLTSANKVLLSMDMFGIVIWQRSVDIDVLGQDVRKIMPHLDIISPMLYPSHFGKNFSGVKNPADEPYFFVSKGIQRIKAIVGDKVVIRPWLQSFPLRVSSGYGPGYIKSQIDAADDSGAKGWLLWSPQNCYQDAFTAIEKLNFKDKPRAAKGSGAK